jgi:glycosyltransferase involved in cell wall biosynthesis
MTRAIDVGPRPRLSIVMPVFGNSDTLDRDLAALEAALHCCEQSYEVIIVVDGDRTAFAVAGTLTSSRVRLLPIEPHHGKGHAVISGMREARGELIGFMDAGGDIDPDAWGTLLTLQREHNADAVVGSKRHPASLVSHSQSRRACSLGYRALVRALFRLEIRDTQVGIKLFRRALVRDVAPSVHTHGFAFDVELLALAQRRGYCLMLEAPVGIHRDVCSTVNVRAVLRMALDTVRIAWHLRATQPSELRPPSDEAVFELAVLD